MMLGLIALRLDSLARRTDGVSVSEAQFSCGLERFGSSPADLQNYESSSGLSQLLDLVTTLVASVVLIDGADGKCSLKVLNCLLVLRAEL